MSVYVDPLVTYTPDAYHGKDSLQAFRVGERNGHQWCHLFADERDSDELHQLARKIGMFAKWFQGDHYDLTPGKRELAVKYGAIEVTRNQAVTIWRKQHDLPPLTPGCKNIETPQVTAGWACCQCATYNGYQREVCKFCGHKRCCKNV